MYVVRRPFKNYGKVLVPGTVITPENIKWFKTRLRDKVIVEVTEQTLDSWDSYFKVKFGVSIKPAKVEPAKAAPAKVEPAKAVKASQAAKAVVKAVVKA